MTENENDIENELTNQEVNKLAFSIRRALMEDVEVPDSMEEFERFRQRNEVMEQSDNNAKIRRLGIAAVYAVAACMAFFFALKPFFDTEETPQPFIAKQTIAGNRVFAATQAAKDITIAIDDEEVDNATAKQNGVTILKNNVISISKSDDGSYETTTITMPQGKVAQLRLDDGSRVWLSADSKIIIPKNFYNNDTRRVEVSGEAYFEVKHDETRPFVVSCNGVETTVLGTKFDVRGYAGEKSMVTLVSGRVRVDTPAENIILTPGEQAVVNAKGKMKVDEVDLDVVLSWKNGEFYFDGQTLREITSEIGRWYDTDVVFANNAHLNDRLHFNADRNWTIHEVVDQLNLISGTKIEIIGNTLKVN